MRLPVVVMLLMLAACSGDGQEATPAPATATTSPVATPAPAPARQHGLRGRLANDPRVVDEMLVGAEPRGVVLCGLDVLGHGPGQLYVWAQCGDFRTGPDAKELSASALPAVVREHRVVFPRQAHLDADIDRMFPRSVAHAIRHRDIHPTPSTDELLELAGGITSAGRRAAPSR